MLAGMQVRLATPQPHASPQPPTGMCHVAALASPRYPVPLHSLSSFLLAPAPAARCLPPPVAPLPCVPPATSKTRLAVLWSAVSGVLLCQEEAYASVAPWAERSTRQLLCLHASPTLGRRRPAPAAAARTRTLALAVGRAGAGGRHWRRAGCAVWKSFSWSFQRRPSTPPAHAHVRVGQP